MPFLSKTDLPQRGYTETFAMEVLSEPALLKLIEEEAERISNPGREDL